jgi:predicted Zn-dependent protease
MVAMNRTTKTGSKKAGAKRGAAAAGHLWSEADLRRLAERVLKFRAADETEVSIDVVTDALTRFANNTIHQNVAEQHVGISVRAVVEGRTARASTNKLDDESLKRTAESAAQLARFQPQNPDLLAMLGPQKYEKVARFFEATAAATPDDRARAVTRVVEAAAARKQIAAGIFTTGVFQSALANSNGLFAAHTQTRAEFSITVMEDDSSGWVKANAPNVDEISPEALAERASRKAADSRGPREIDPGRYTVILEPSAVQDLVGFLFYDFSATAVADQRSCLNERLGKKIFGENVTLWDDVYHPLQTGLPFDGEGVPRQRVLLVERGVPRNLVYGRATAKKMNTAPTGHGFSLPNEFGEAPMNLVLEGGSASLDEMIAGTERGILVTRLWYIREVDPYEKVLTGMTRDGTFLVENGRVTGGIKNFRFNQSMLEMLSNVEMMSPSVRAAGEESFEMVVPAMKVREFHFTEVTRF